MSTVNGQRVNIPSYRVKEGDVIEVREKSKQMAAVLEAVQLPERDVPDYIEADHSKMTATFVRTPGLGDVPYPVHDGTEPRHRILRAELTKPCARSSAFGRC
jgi:small subunit ribosomal protein S4